MADSVRSLSIAASVAGLLGVSSKVIYGLTTFASIIPRTPESLQRVVAEVSHVNIVLAEVQKLITRQSDVERLDGARLALIPFDHLVTTLTGCILLFSELEKHTDALVGAADSGSGSGTVWATVSWTRKEKEMGKLMDGLHIHRTSLNLMLTIVGCTDQGEAVESARHLHSAIADLLEPNRAINAQLRALMARADTDHFDDTASVSEISSDDAASVRTASSDDAASGGTAGPAVPDTRSEPLAAAPNEPFERVLRKSKVYKHDRLWNMSRNSLDGSSTASTGRPSIWTASLSEASIISVFARPLTFSSKKLRLAAQTLTQKTTEWVHLQVPLNPAPQLNKLYTTPRKR